MPVLMGLLFRSCMSELSSTRKSGQDLPVVVLSWNVVLRNLVCCHFRFIGVRRMLHAAHYFRLERLSFFGQLFHALGIRERLMRQSRNISGLARGSCPQTLSLEQPGIDDFPPAPNCSLFARRSSRARWLRRAKRLLRAVLPLLVCALPAGGLFLGHVASLSSAHPANQGYKREPHIAFQICA